MFRWLKSKVTKNTEDEYVKILNRNQNFLEYVKSFSTNSKYQKLEIKSLWEHNQALWSSSYSKINMEKAKDVDLACRTLFAKEYGGSDFKYDSKFRFHHEIEN